MTVEAVTFGCRLNILESESIRRHAANAGLTDTIVVNTCAVTNEAVSQARQTIRKLRRERADARVVVTGCAAQTMPGMFSAMPEVDRVVGNDDKLRPAGWHATRAALAGDRAGAATVAVSDIMAVRDAAAQPIDSFDGHARAFLQVQNGCDHRCTFCIIPFGRGNSRSVPPEEVVAQARRLAERGYREVVLTGVDLTSYGQHLADAPKLGALVKAILREVPEIARLRLSSIAAAEADADLIDAFAREPRLMPHLHLSLQAGDDLVLKRMKRRHSRADAVRFCADLRRLRPDVVLGADLIAGFPTETEAMFANSLALVDDCGLTHLHVFPFSPRPGTPAARMPQVMPREVAERAARLRAKGHDALRRHLDGAVGRPHLVLAERGGIGRTEQFTPVKLAAPASPGSFVHVTAVAHDGRHLIAA